MLPRNPFFIRNTEKIDTVSSFLALFNPDIINFEKEDGSRFISHDDLGKTIIFRSTPGGGKSSIFRLFSPNVLSEVLHTQNENKEAYEFLKELNAIDETKVNVLGVYIPCARNYSMIEDIYENGKRIQVFFALINVRIVREALKNILTLTNNGNEALNKINFRAIPEELSAVIDNNWTGKQIYDWAIEEENKLCSSIDDMDDKLQVAFYHNVLSSLLLLEPQNILFEGKPIVDKTLIMFDDVHKLAKRQRKEMLNCIYTLRPNIGIWVAERSSALDDDQVLGDDGKIGREYDERQIEDLLSANRSFTKALIAVADRRVRINHRDTIGSFDACIENNLLSDQTISSKIEKIVEKFELEILPHNLIEYYEEQELSSIYDKAVFLRLIKILQDRKKNNLQISFDFNQTINETDVNKFLKLRPIAEFYLCIENEIPYYFGLNKLCELSFDNMDQFLSFAGAIFERRIASSYVMKKNNKKIVSPKDQESIIRKVCQQKWDELTTQFLESDRIINLLNNVGKIGEHSRKKAHASYSGGAYTGIGIKYDVFSELMKDSNNNPIIHVLSDCVTANLLKTKTVRQGNSGEKWKIFSLNRWLCVKYNLPFSSGGWKRINSLTINKLISDGFDVGPLDIHEYEEELYEGRKLF